MEKSYLTKAVVIKRQDYREYDSLVVFYTLNEKNQS
jgi:recombinational DNA repair protein (RecF pathway)